MAENLQSPSHTPQPTHWVLSMTAFPSRMLMAGQPSFMHALQLLHLSVST